MVSWALLVTFNSSLEPRLTLPGFETSLIATLGFAQAIDGDGNNFVKRESQINYTSTRTNVPP